MLPNTTELVKFFMNMEIEWDFGTLAYSGPLNKQYIEIHLVFKVF